MQSQTKKVLLVVILLSVIAVFALPITRSGSMAFFRDSKVGVKLSVLMQQPISNAALSRIADQSLQRIEGEQSSIEAGKQYKLDKLNLNELKAEIAKLSAREAPATNEKLYQNTKIGAQQPVITDNYLPGIALDILEQETGLKRAELEALLAEEL